MTSSAEVENQILAEVKKISRVLTLMATKDLAQREKIGLLSGLGLQPREIAELVGTTPNTVSVTLSSMRRQQPTTTRKRKEAKA